ncbi:MAG: hypothetical protein AAGA20_09280 [Planctomycetota bacterium]
MSQKSQKASEVPEGTTDEHEDDLIVVPKGQSRLRYIATIGLVLFLLVIFVVADTFQSSLTGGGGASDPVYLTWEDPVDGQPNQVNQSEFVATNKLLSMMTQLRAYYPDSLLYGERDPRQRLRQDPQEEDVASFLVFEDMADDAGVEIGQEELIDRLRQLFGDAQGLNLAAAQTRMPPAQLEDSIRRVMRVSKLKSLLMGAVVVPDADAVVTTWQEQHPKYKFQVVTAKRDDLVDQARTEIPGDDVLLEWFRERPMFEQQRLYTEVKVVPEVAYVPLTADGNFDWTPLLEAYPSPEGIDLDEQARNYHRQVRASRFRVPPEETSEDDADEADDPTPPKAFYEFEDVEEQVRYEAPIHAAVGAFLTDLQDRAAEGEEIDLAAEAERVGLTYEKGAEGGATRAELAETPVWGAQDIAGQLVFAQPGAFVTRVVVGENAMTVARAVSKVDREEPPFEEIREEVADLWAQDRGKELAVDALDTMRQVLAEKPEDVELADWRPVVDVAQMEQLAKDAGYAFYDRPWLERNEQPSGANATVLPVDRFLSTRAELFEMEPGQTAPPVASFDGSEAYLVRLEGEQEPDPGDIDAQTLFQMRAQTRGEDRREFGAKVFLADGPWLSERAKIAFPERERREAEQAAEADTGSAASE